VNDISKKSGLGKALFSRGSQPSCSIDKDHAMSHLKTGLLDDVLVVRLNESRIVDSELAEEIGLELLDQVSRATEGKLLLDLQGVTFVCSAMIGQIFWLNNKCMSQNVRFRACNVTPELQGILDIVNIGDVVDILPDTTQAQLAFAQDQVTQPTEAESKTADDYQQDAENGDVQAQYDLARCYDEGRGVEQNGAKAFNWYSKAAEGGLPEAQYSLGRSFAFGIHVHCDYEAAVGWYKKAAEQGHADAQYLLAVLHRWGIGIDEDRDQAIKWYRRAAEQGHAAAERALREMEAA
jgi:anti-anti-sigma regulatory factor